MGKCVNFFLVPIAFLCTAGAVLAAPVQWSENGHYYELVDGSYTWDEARASANASTYEDISGVVLSGHLVTITSDLENLFLTNNALLGNGDDNLLHLHWTGGYQPFPSDEPSGGWAWVTGEDFEFNNWSAGEPNDGVNEDRIVFDHVFSQYGKDWNDLSGLAPTYGYIVEFDGLRDEIGEIPGAPVPEPATLVLFSVGLAGIASFRRKRMVKN